MKRGLYLFVILVLCAACSKDLSVSTPQTLDPSNVISQTDPVKICFDISSPGGQDTKAVKQGWENGDRIFFWFDSVLEIGTVNHTTKESIRDWDLILTYDGSVWNCEYQASNLSSTLMTSTPDASGCYYGQVYAIWTSGNDLDTQWSRSSLSRETSPEAFIIPAQFIKPNNTSPMILTSGFSAGSLYADGYMGADVKYRFSSSNNTLELVNPSNVTQTIQLPWKFYTNFQITVTGLEPGKLYGLSSESLGVSDMLVSYDSDNTVYSLERFVPHSRRIFDRVSNQDMDSPFTFANREIFAIANNNGEAIFYGLWSSTSQSLTDTYTFMLQSYYDGQPGSREERLFFRKTITTVNASDTRLTAVKLQYYDFPRWYIYGEVNSNYYSWNQNLWNTCDYYSADDPFEVDYASVNEIFHNSNSLIRTSTPDNSANPLVGTWEADVYYEEGGLFCLTSQPPRSNKSASYAYMNNNWDYYDLGPMVDGYLVENGGKEIILGGAGVDGTGSGYYHIVFTYPSCSLVVSKNN